jgi:hypothetical protein
MQGRPRSIEHESDLRNLLSIERAASQMLVKPRNSGKNKNRVDLKLQLASFDQSDLHVAIVRDE